jgi:hypothetical protein
MKPITQDPLREIVEDFARAIREKKAGDVKPALAVINFRDDISRGRQRPIESVPIDLLRYRKYNGRIASDVMNYEKQVGHLDEKDANHQGLLCDFLKKKDPEMTDTLIKSIEHSGQSEPAIITCDGFLINGNRRKMAFEALRKKHPGEEKYNYLKVVILPAPNEEGGPPTILEIERLENRYQLQSEGKAEYYNFDRALSMKRKISGGFSLEEQLRDDPRYANASETELKKAIKQYEKEFIAPLECIDRYLKQFGREGMYGTISSGKSDREGRWQAFLDYSNAYGRLRNPQWQIENGIEEDDVGTYEEAAFKMIRLGTLKDLPKIHSIMRKIPTICAQKESRRAILDIANGIDSSLPKDDLFDTDGNPISSDEVDKKWAHRNQQKMIMFTKKALDHIELSREHETPVALLEAALKKLTHEEFILENIPHRDYHEAARLAREIQQAAKIIERSLYDNEKKLQELSRKK